MAGVFISYRRDEDGDRAERLYKLLLRRLKAGEVFIDVDMEIGLDFHERLGTEAGRCNVMLAVIGRGWSDVEADDGGRALDNPRDWVRMELEAALRRDDVRVIPVLVGGAPMPAEEDLPETLQAFVRRQGRRLRNDSFELDAERLADDLARYLRTFEADTRNGVEPEPSAVGEAPWMPLAGAVIAVPVAYVASYWVVDAVSYDTDAQKIVGLAAFRGLFWAVFAACVAAVWAGAGAAVGHGRAAKIAAAAGGGLAIGALAGAPAGALTEVLRLDDHEDTALILGFALTGALLGAGRVASRSWAGGMMGGLLGGALGGLLAAVSDTGSAFVNQAIAASAIVLGIVLAAAIQRSRPAEGHPRRIGTVARG